MGNEMAGARDDLRGGGNHLLTPERLRIDQDAGIDVAVDRQADLAMPVEGAREGLRPVAATHDERTTHVLAGPPA